MGLFTKKPIELLLAQANEEGDHALRRGLGAASLTLLGIGGVIGAGIFVLTGQQAAINAGPGIVLSFVLAGVVCAFCALCYSELASMIPVAGSAYTYTYATIGEFFAWLIAWDLILEYGIAAATVSAGWSGYFNRMLSGFGVTLPTNWSTAPYTWDGHAIVQTGATLNLPAMAIIALMAAFLIAGITESKIANNTIVSLKMCIVLAVIGFGFAHVDPKLWHPLIPPHIPPTPAFPQGQFGLNGVAQAASVIFFAYIGFEAVSTAAQEAKDPQRTMPIGILGSLAICTVLYVLMALVTTGMAPYQTLNNPAPVATALANVPSLAWLTQIVNIGVAVGLGSTILSLLYGQSRIIYAMTRDGLLPGLLRRGQCENPHADLGHGDRRRLRRPVRRAVSHQDSGRAGVHGHAAGVRPDLHGRALSALFPARPPAPVQDALGVPHRACRRAGLRLSDLQAAARDLAAAIHLDGHRPGGLFRLCLLAFQAARGQAFDLTGIAAGAKCATCCRFMRFWTR